MQIPESSRAIHRTRPSSDLSQPKIRDLLRMVQRGDQVAMYDVDLRGQSGLRLKQKEVRKRAFRSSASYPGTKKVQARLGFVLESNV